MLPCKYTNTAINPKISILTWFTNLCMYYGSNFMKYKYNLPNINIFNQVPFFSIMQYPYYHFLAVLL